MTSGATRPPRRRRDILALGPTGLGPLPSADAVAAMTPDERHQTLEGLRGQLYDLASVVADRAMQRSWQQRHRYPPYGLVRSLFTQMRVVADDPGAYEERSITGFTDLGKALVDTLVFHLDRELAFIGEKGPRWVPGRLADLLALFRLDAGADAQARLRDPFAFLYGGLHFGASTSVQAVEVMNRLLDVHQGGSRLNGEAKAAVLHASIRVVHQLATVNLADIPAVYRRLTSGPGDAGAGPVSSWFRPECFMVDERDHVPHRVDFRPDLLADIDPGQEVRYATRGCPARYSPSEGPGAITVLWHWCVDLAGVTGLLER
jgi:hypothetical protein